MQRTYDLWNEVSRYLEGRISIEQLEDWLLPRLGEYLASPAGIDSELASIIELGLAEMSSGHWSEEEFRDWLRQSVRMMTSPRSAFP